ncbi:MAG TPA: DUF3267 domain-containing protein [Thermoanaerobaculia bacterium]|nr:DUF3267 domain-containing protein [Thermoanaerobaculia bacterium]
MRARLGSAAVLLFAFVAALSVFTRVWQRSAFEDLAKQPGGWLGAIAIVACSAIVHELLHAIAWMLVAHVPWRAISFHPTWRGLGLAARVDTPLPARAYKIGVAVPALTLGLIPIVIGIATGSGLWLLWGLFFLFECFADLIVLFTGQIRQ